MNRVGAPKISNVKVSIMWNLYYHYIDIVKYYMNKNSRE